MADNRLYQVLKALKSEIADSTKLRVDTDNFTGTESIVLVPVSQELIDQAAPNVNYFRYTIALLYQTSEDVDTRELTQTSSNIVSTLNATRQTVDSTIFYNPQVEEVIFQPETLEAAEGEELQTSGQKINLQITFGVTTQEIIT